MNPIKSVVLIGAGRVASSLAVQIKAAGFDLRQIVSAHEQSCKKLADKVGCAYTTNKADLQKADLYICSVNDDAIENALQGADFSSGLLVHTAGSVEMSVLKPYAENFGVLYPMQTFSAEKQVEAASIPFYIEACNTECRDVLCDFVSKLGGQMRLADSQQRKNLHIAAVFASNFANHCYQLAYEILQQSGLQFEDLLPLIDETAAKVHKLTPKQGQSGPAIRHDNKILSMHINSLSGNKRAVYELLSRSIQESGK